MENSNPIEKKKAKFSENKELISKLKAEYFTGKLTLMQISVKEKVWAPLLYRQARIEAWKEQMEEMGIPIPVEPRPSFSKLPPEIWTAIESEFMRGETITSIARRHNISQSAIKSRATKFRWNYYRDQINESRRKRNLGDELAARISEFDDISIKFVEAAIDRLKTMAQEIEDKNYEIGTERLEKLIKLHSSLYESIKKIPSSKRSAMADKNIHPALRPATIVKIG